MVSATEKPPQFQAVHRVRRAAFGLELTLVAQFLVGMLINLFVELPRAHPGAQPSDYFSGSVQSVFWAATGGPLLLIAHILVGLLLFAGSIGLLVTAWRLHRGVVTTFAVAGFLSILFAGFNGASFLDYNEDFSSMLMATGLALAAASYAALLYVVGAA